MTTDIKNFYANKYLNADNYVSAVGSSSLFKATNDLVKFEITFINGDTLIVVMSQRQRDMLKRTKYYSYIKTCGGLGYVKEKPVVIDEPAPIKQHCMLSYDKLMSYNPTVFGSHINKLGQTIQFVEHPLRGDEAQVICVCPSLKLAAYSSFFETTDMIQDHKEYEPSFINGMFFIGDMLNN